MISFKYEPTLYYYGISYVKLMPILNDLFLIWPTLSEWLLFNANSAIFPAKSWREQVKFQWDDDEVHFVLDQHPQLDYYSASSLKQQSAGKHVAPLGHNILITSQPVFGLSL